MDLGLHLLVSPVLGHTHLPTCGSMSVEGV